jgi:F-type H+-transporting ATPase subunit a
MDISPDSWILYEWRGWRLNATIVFTWVVMALLVLGSWAVTARLSEGETVSRWQVMLEVIVSAIRDQIAEVGADDPGRYLPFIGTLFLFIATANVLAVVPGYQPPTGSLSTTAALAICVLIAVPLFSIGERGLGSYLRTYLQPTPLMLPFNLVSEVSRTIALAVRLYGNVMSGTVIVGILISVAPFFFPVVMQVAGPADRSDPGLHLRHPRDGLHRLGQPQPPGIESPARPSKDRNRRLSMDSATLVAVISIFTAGLTIAIGSIGPALAEGRAASQALQAIAQQPDASNTITRTLFVSLAMIESTAIYCFVVSMILIFANPFTNLVAETAAQAAGG